MLEGKTPVFIGAAPSATSSATHGRRYFLPGRSDNLGLPRLTANKAKPTQSLKVNKPSMLIPSADSLDPSSPPTPTPKHKSKPSKGKGKAKKVKSDSENDDKPLKAPARRRIPKPTSVYDNDSDLRVHFIVPMRRDWNNIDPKAVDR